MLLLERLVGSLCHPNRVECLRLESLELNILKFQFIVVIPNPGASVVEILSLKLALPPLFGLGVAEVDEGSLTTPEELLIRPAALVLDEIPLLFQLCIPRMAGQDSRLDVHAQIISTRREGSQKRLVVGKLLFVPEKRIPLALGTLQIA
ncbi:hypothetical protein SDC9_65348 [bioreactor metagenome]|uniref:Uncharacterized protein n=1 Tax=bioreactor metagenome TaxID=1076179 RepID=A0A644XRR4_9ZZZZ